MQDSLLGCLLSPKMLLYGVLRKAGKACKYSTRQPSRAKNPGGIPVNNWVNHVQAHRLSVGFRVSLLFLAVDGVGLRMAPGTLNPKTLSFGLWRAYAWSNPGMSMLPSWEPTNMQGRLQSTYCRV